MQPYWNSYCVQGATNKESLWAKLSSSQSSERQILINTVNHINLKVHLGGVWILDYLEYRASTISHTPKWKKKKGLTRLKSVLTIEGFVALFISIIIRCLLSQPSPASCPWWWPMFCSMIGFPLFWSLQMGAEDGLTQAAISQGMQGLRETTRSWREAWDSFFLKASGRNQKF